MVSIVYIPIWLDLLCEISLNGISQKICLHSNMVRFIINTNEKDGVGDL